MKTWFSCEAMHLMSGSLPYCFSTVALYWIVVFDGELLGKRGGDYVTAIVTWHDDFQPENCLA